MSEEVEQEFYQGRPVVWRPNSGPQTRFVACGAYEVLYGGSAGGGKTDGLLAGYTRHIAKPSYTGIIFRRTLPQLTDVIERSYEIMKGIDPGAEYKAQRNFWRFSSGARLFFRSMEHEKNKLDYKGRAFQYIGFDQLEDFTETQYVYLLSRGRSVAGIPIRIRSTANPGGVGHSWIMKRFGPWLDPKCEKKADPGEVLHYRNTEEGPEYCARAKGTIGRVFIPARLEDNPPLAKTDYRVHLMGLDPVTRAQLLYGDWLVRPKAGDYFKREWVIGPDGSKLLEKAPRGVRWLRYWDRASTEPTKGKENPDWTRGVKIGVLGDRIIVGHVASCRKRPASVQELVLQTAALDGQETEIGIEQDPAQAGVAEAAAYIRMLRAYYVRAHPAQSKKLIRFKPFSAQAEAGNVEIVRGDWNDDWLNELEAFPDPDWHDDLIDATGGGYNALMDDESESTASDWKRSSTKARKEPPPPPPDPDQPKRPVIKTPKKTGSSKSQAIRRATVKLGLFV